TATATVTGTPVATSTSTATATATTTGTVGPSSVGNLRLINPVRVIDTRTGPSSPLGPIGFRPGGVHVPAAQLQANTTTRFLIAGQTFAGTPFPADVTGLLLNVTIVSPGANIGGGYVTVFPGDAAVAPNASTVNPSTVIANNFWSVGVPRTGV